MENENLTNIDDISIKAMYDVVIIGGGPAGYTAALYASRAGLSTLVVERLGAGGQMTTTDIIDNYPGFPDGIDGFELGMRMQKGAERFGAVTMYGEVTKVELRGDTKLIEVGGDAYGARTVIVSTGAAPRALGIPMENEFVGRGIHYCAHCDGRFYKDKTVIVVGGGNSAAADALYLSHLAKRVMVVHRRDTLRATRIYHEPLEAAENIEFVWNSEVVELKNEDGRVSGAVVKDKISGEYQEIACDGVFVSIGRKPETSLLGGQLELDENGYIMADETTRTNLPGVYAVGDVRRKALRQVVTAVSDGAVAVHFAEEYLSSFKL